MYGGRSSSVSGIPNFFTDLTGNEKGSSPVKTKSVKSLAKSRRSVSSSGSSSSSSSDDDSRSYSSSSRSTVSPSPSRQSTKKRPHSPREKDDPPKDTKKPKKTQPAQLPLQPQSKKEVSFELEAFAKNSLDKKRLVSERDALKLSYETHIDKLKELSEMEEKVAVQKDILDRSTRLVDDSMLQLEELEAKEAALLQKIKVLEEEQATFEAKKEEWHALRERIAVSLGFTKKDL